MDNGEADELGRFRRSISEMSLAQLAPVIADVMDEFIDLVRRLDQSSVAVEVAAALSAELHRRHAAESTIRSTTVGQA